ncbi:MAG: hypothetical protein QOE72_4622 [Chloroflexota bacterium]|jgi:transcriptional regulator with XRE-family HTH domain|nr:hypothetical protein [Chloroflexota bacterium]
MPEAHGGRHVRHPRSAMMDPDRFPLACLIHRERGSRAWSLEKLATAVTEAAARERTYCGATRQTVFNWEGGQIPHPDTIRWIAAALGVPVERLAAARAVQMRLTRRQLLRHAALAGGALVAPGAAGVTGGRGFPWTPRPGETDEVIGYLRRAFSEFDTADWLFGPALLLSTVDAHLGLVQHLLAVATGYERSELLSVGARYAEFASWLNQDSGNAPAAGYWADRAMDWAHEVDDALMVSYVLMRKSSQAATQRDAGRTIGLARVAQHSDRLTPRVRAVAAQQEAHGHALAGDEVACQRKLDEAFQLSAADRTVEGPARYCIPQFVEIQRATCWMELGRPERAVDLFEAELLRLPAVHRRDRGVYLSRLACAHATTGNPDGAAVNARQALEIVGTTGSDRIRKELHQLQPRLARWRELPAVAEVYDVMSGMV